MERYGFSDVTADYALIHLTPDAKDTPQEMAEAMIEAARQSDLEAIRSARSAGGERAASAVNARYDERLRLLRAGIKQWDTELSVTMIVRGRK